MNTEPSKLRKACRTPGRADGRRARPPRLLYRLLTCLLPAVLLLTGGCDDFLPDEDFKPTGTPFSLNPGLALVNITGGQQPLPTGTYTIDMTCQATGGAPVSQSFPAGLQFISTQRRVQHVIMLKPQTAEFGTDETRSSLGVFCGNRYRRTPDRLDTFELGPVTDNRELREIAELVRDRSITAGIWMVQRAVWMVTDSTGLNQAYRDSLAALPSETR